MPNKRDRSLCHSIQLDSIEKRLIRLEGRMIDFIRFHLGFRIAHCDNCNIIVDNWEGPLVFKCAPNTKGEMCKQHRKEMDEFNHKYASG